MRVHGQKLRQIMADGCDLDGGKPNNGRPLIAMMPFTHTTSNRALEAALGQKGSAGKSGSTHRSCTG